jgi:hypothetical protein
MDNIVVFQVTDNYILAIVIPSNAGKEIWGRNIDF